MLKELRKKYQTKMAKIAVGWFLTSIMVVVFMAFTIIMIEYAIPSQNIELIIILGISYFLVNIIRAITTFFEDLCSEGYTKEFQSHYRKKVFHQLQQLTITETDRCKAGEILQSMLNDTKEVARYWETGIVRSYIGGPVRLIGTILVLMYLNIPIMTIVMGIYTLGFILAYFWNKKSIHLTEEQRNINAKILTFSHEQVEGQETIKSLEIQSERMKELKQLLTKYEQKVNLLEKNIRIYTNVYTLLISFIGVMNILIGGIGVEQGMITYASLVILVRYVSTPETYAKWIIEGFQIRNVCRIAYEKIESIMQKEQENTDVGEKIDNIQTIELKDVEFAYTPEEKILNQICLQAKESEKIALIGRTGSGKTTLVNLLCRFYEPTKGQIVINGKDYHEYSISSLRNKIGYIMQKVVIINGTILDNINYAQKDISLEEIIKICQKLNLHEKISQLEKGYQTKITKDTNLFSSGEKQLINFARVMIENPDVIILDEVTSSLSYHSEMLIREAIEEITKGKISFIIAHRLSTIQNCDKIVFLKQGKIIEQGKHEELMKKQGEYYQLLTN